MSRAIRRSFSKAAVGYRGHARVQEAMAGWLAEWLPPKIEGPSLEIGAGPGIFTRYLQLHSDALTATDLSEEMCEAGRQAVPEATWRVMDASSPEAGPWRWIFSSSVLQWLEDPQSVFETWRKVMMPGGRILAGLYAAGSLPELGSLLGKSQLVWRTSGEWRRVIERAGFRLLRAEEAERRFISESARGFLRELHGVGAAPERLLSPPELRRLLDGYDERYGSSGGVRATWRFLRLDAQLD